MSLRTVHVATADTRHFEFEGFGATAAEAEQALRAAYALHAAHTGADPTLLDGEDAVHLRAVTLGAGYRDREPLTQPAPQADPVQDAHAARENATRTLRESAVTALFAKVNEQFPSVSYLVVENDGDNGMGGIDLRINFVEGDGLTLTEDDDSATLDDLNDDCGHELAMLADADPDMGYTTFAVARPTA